MKRIYIAAVLLIITLSICIYELRFVSRSCNDFSHYVTEIQAAYEDTEYDAALNLTKMVNDKWQKNVHKIDMLLYHDYVDEITDNLSKLSIFISKEDESQFLATCREIKNQLESLKNNEIPILENII